MSEHEKRLEVKNKEDDLKKGLMQHMKQEVDNRDAKTVTTKILLPKMFIVE